MFAVQHVTVHSQFLMHSPSHRHRAVQSGAAFLHLQRFTQPFLHLHDSSSRQVWLPVVILSSGAHTAPPLFWSTPAGCRRQLWCREQHLAPYMTSLVGCPLNVLFQSCLGWRNQLHIVLPCKKFLACIVNVCACTCSAVQEDDKSLNGVQDLFWYVTWCR